MNIEPLNLDEPFSFLSVCSGIEAASVAWEPLGWKAVAFSEIEPFPSAVLNHHYPHVPNHGDMTKFHEWPKHRINLLVGGTPCQAFSVAGLREGLADPRGNLTLTFLGLADKYRPEWVVWENVPGVLSDRTNAFGQLLAGLGQLGFGCAYRVLDAQYFGLAQRRKRVFVVGCLGGWERAAAVLFEPACLLGHPAPSREAGKGFTYPVAPCIGASGRGFERSGDTRGNDCVIPIQEIGKRQSGNAMNGVGHGKDGDPMFTLQSSAVHGVVAPCLKKNNGKNSDAAMEASSLIAIPETVPTLRSGAASGGKGHGARSGDSKDELIIPVAHSTSGAGYWTEGINALRAREQESHEHLVAHTLKAEGFDASEDGTGRGTPLVPVKWLAEIAPTLNAAFGAKQGLEDQHALGGGGLFVPARNIPLPERGRDGEKRCRNGNDDSDASRRFL